MAANAYKHVLCEKPLAVTVEQAEHMMEVARRRHVRLMTAYRLHLEPATLRAVELAQSGKLGELRSFASTFGFPLHDRKNIRASSAHGGGALYDIGIYCINAARKLFAAEPTEVFAHMPPAADAAVYRDVDETVSVLLKFPGGRTAIFTASFNIAGACRLELQGTKGKVVMDPAYVYAEPLTQEVTLAGKTTRKTYPKEDQFARMLRYFTDCIEQDKVPLAGSAAEGIADLRVIEAIQKSAKLNRAIRL